MTTSTTKHHPRHHHHHRHPRRWRLYRLRLHHWHRRHPPLPLAAKRDEFENPPIIVNSSHAPHTTSLLSSTTQSLATSSGKDNIASQFPHAKNSIRFACIFFPLHSSSFSPSDRRRLLIGASGSAFSSCPLVRKIYLHFSQS